MKLQIALILAFLLTNSLKASTQEKPANPERPASLTKDTVSNGAIAYNRIVSGSSVSRPGLFTLHLAGDSLYMEVPDHLLNKDILMVSRIATGAENAVNLYSGDEMGKMIIRFEKRSDRGLLVRRIQFSTHTGDSASMMFQTILRSGLSPILASFAILGRSGTNTSLINFTELVTGEGEGFSLSAITKKLNDVTTLEKGKSYISSVSSYPENTEIQIVKTYSNPTPRFGEINSLTVELNVSLVLLPVVPMQQRFEDERVGYFSIGQVDFEGSLQGVSSRRYIKRWRLQPKAEDREKYLGGVLVEPENPIVFYIDPATPAKWIPYIIEGVNDWRVAFEQAGFKNAITGRPAPGKFDTAWSLFDARHSAVVYKPSGEANASGPSITDPRSGEILESHINFHHNLQKLVQWWYMLQCGAVDPHARKAVFADSLMGRLIRQVIAHEVGHTLGLTHNMAASSTVPVEKLRDKHWVAENGICPSIMDYARFNYVAQPQDSIASEDLVNRIGAYDKWAIEWGYRWRPQFTTPEEEAAYLNAWTARRLEDRRLWYGPQNNTGDPRIQVEDLGDDAVTASTYGLKNLKRILPRLIEWTNVPNMGYWNLQSTYFHAQNQFSEYLIHVIDQIGGTMETLKRSDQPGGIYSPVDASVQKKAFEFLNRELFTTPLWLVDTTILVRTGDTRMGVIGRLQERALRALVNVNRFNAMFARNESTFEGKQYSLSQLLNDLEICVWTELDRRKPVDHYRRSLQKQLVLQLMDVYKNSPGQNYLMLHGTNAFVPLYSTDVPALVGGHLRQLQDKIKKNLPLIKDKATLYHLQFIIHQIEQLWNITDAQVRIAP